MKYKLKLTKIILTFKIISLKNKLSFFFKIQIHFLKFKLLHIKNNNTNLQISHNINLCKTAVLWRGAWVFLNKISSKTVGAHQTSPSDCTIFILIDVRLIMVVRSLWLSLPGFTVVCTRGLNRTKSHDISGQ